MLTVTTPEMGAYLKQMLLCIRVRTLSRDGFPGWARRVGTQLSPDCLAWGTDTGLASKTAGRQIGLFLIQNSACVSLMCCNPTSYSLQIPHQPNIHPQVLTFCWTEDVRSSWSENTGNISSFRIVSATSVSHPGLTLGCTHKHPSQHGSIATPIGPIQPQECPARQGANFQPRRRAGRAK